MKEKFPTFSALQILLIYFLLKAWIFSISRLEQHEYPDLILHYCSSFAKGRIDAGDIVAGLWPHFKAQLDAVNRSGNRTLDSHALNFNSFVWKGLSFSPLYRRQRLSSIHQLSSHPEHIYFGTNRENANTHYFKTNKQKCLANHDLRDQQNENSAKFSQRKNFVQKKSVFF